MVGENIVESSFDQIGDMTQRFAGTLPDEFDPILAIEKIGHGWRNAGDIEYFTAANGNDARSRAVFRLTPHAANEQGTVVFRAITAFGLT